MISALDGPAASGKRTLARALAKRFGLVFLDTGPMYRAVTLEVRRRGVDPHDGVACGLLARELELDFDEAGRISIQGRPGEPAIRGEEVSREVSLVAAHPEVRGAIVPLQRRIAASSVRGVVAEGRDTTTVVFPDAELKLFLTASSKERARRRAAELGRELDEDRSRVRSDLERRDHLDRSRADSPLRRADGAVDLETDGLGPDEVLERAVGLATDRGFVPVPSASRGVRTGEPGAGDGTRVDGE
jgi:cytidylate kinase